MKILFVDDEQAILRTLRRTLRHRAATDQMDFESNPLEAIRRLEETCYDLVVSDMRMPGCSGFQVLEQAARTNPSGVRVILSGYSGEEETAKVAELAHLFIGKPFDPKALTDLVDRASALQAMPLSVPLRRRLGSLTALPPIPTVYVALTRALSDETSAPSMDEIASLLAQDMGVTAKILQMANSAFFGARARVLRVDQAVKLLGTRLLSGLVLQHELDVHSRLPPALEAWREQVNQESLATAALAASIARYRGMDSSARDEASLGGLLHDLGRLVLAAEAHEKGIPNQLANVECGEQLCREEEALFGTHHGWVGAYLLRLWGFPLSVVEAVAWHHQPSASGIAGFGTLTLVHAADALCAGHGHGEVRIDRAYLEQLGCLDELEQWAGLRKS